MAEMSSLKNSAYRCGMALLESSVSIANLRSGAVEQEYCHMTLLRR
ncbi:MAG: hypothetical protein ACXWTL_03460 [Methylobacter sp.]